MTLTLTITRTITIAALAGTVAAATALPATPAHAQEPVCIAWGEDHEEVEDPKYGPVLVVTAYCKMWDSGGGPEDPVGDDPKDGTDIPKGASPDPKDYESREEYCKALDGLVDDLTTRLGQMEGEILATERTIDDLMVRLPDAERRRDAARIALSTATALTDQRQVEYAEQNDLDLYAEVTTRNGNEIQVQLRITRAAVNPFLPGGSALLSAIDAEQRAENLSRTTSAEVNRLSSDLRSAQQHYDDLRQAYAETAKQLEQLRSEQSSTCK